MQTDKIKYACKIKISKYKNKKILLKIFVCFGFSETGSYYLAQAGLDLTILLPQPLEYWYYRSMPLSSFIIAFSTHTLQSIIG